MPTLDCCLQIPRILALARQKYGPPTALARPASHAHASPCDGQDGSEGRMRAMLRSEFYEQFPEGRDWRAEADAEQALWGACKPLNRMIENTFQCPHYCCRQIPRINAGQKLPKTGRLSWNLQRQRPACFSSAETYAATPKSTSKCWKACRGSAPRDSICAQIYHKSITNISQSI